jgi:Domain of unknown function (DUF4190)
VTTPPPERPGDRPGGPEDVPGSSGSPYGTPDQPYGQPPYEQQPYGQAPYGQAPYGSPPPYGQPAGPAQTEPMAVIGLIASVVGLCFAGLLLGAAGAVLGFVARNRIRASGGAKKGEGLATAAIVVGVIAALLSVVLIALALSSGDGLFVVPGA